MPKPHLLRLVPHRIYEDVEKAMVEADKRRAAEIEEWRRRGETKPDEPAQPEPEPEPKAPPAPRGVPNEKKLACPVCGLVPERVRTNGEDMARHLPAKAGVKLYRDTEFCDGQGRPGVPP